MKILNLYAGIGGNRKLWKGDITAVENNEEIAKVYKHLFPNDKIVIGDAHQYLLDHFREFDFIWSSPPCQTHSKTNWFLHHQGIVRYPDMQLYQEILFLQQWGKDTKWVVENVVGYYKPLVKAKRIGRHYFWSNFDIPDKKINYVQIGTMNRSSSKEAQRKAIIREAQVPELLDLHGLKDFKIKNKRQVLRNCVYPSLGKHVLESINKLKKKKEYKPTTSGAGSSNGPSQSVTRESVKEKVKEKVKIKNTLIAIPKDYNFVKVRHIGKIQVQLVKDIPNGATIKKMYIDDLK